MATVETYSKTGSKATTAAKLPKTVFGLEVKNHDLLQQAFETYRANGRNRIASVKDRSEVRGGGKKPWKQKGTGRARHGSISSPIWRGGGVTFGPSSNRNYSKQLNRKAKQTALRQALSLAAEHNTIKVIETFECKDGKVKPTITFLEKIGATRGVLLVVSNKDSLVERATRNISYVKAVQANYLNVFDILTAHNIIISKKSLELVESWLGGEKS